MKRVFSAALSGAVVVFALLYAHSVVASSEHKVLMPDDVKWAPAPASVPKGAEAAVIYGDPSKEDLFAMRLRLPAGYHIPPHTHPKPEIVTVISGVLLLGEGATADQGKTTALPAGSFFVMAPGMQHFVYTEQETVLQLNSSGPWGLTYVNPQDDPRKTQ
jgi:quercetin dioxygenase-like cupin family protein